MPWKKVHVHRYRAVFFDLDHTLLIFEPRLFDLFRVGCREQGVALDRQAIRQGERFIQAYYGHPTAYDDWRRLDKAAYWQNLTRLLLDELALTADPVQCAQPLLTGLTDDNVRVYCPPEAHRTLRHLQQSGYTLGLLSNREKPLDEPCRQHGLEGYFDVALSSGQAGAAKPDPRIFTEALRRVGVAADEAVYVGDNYFTDVVGAQRAGLTPLFLDPDRIFPEATCPVIERIDQVIGWLDAAASTPSPTSL